MLQALRFPPPDLPPECETLRAEVREFLAEELPRTKDPRNSDFGASFSPEFSLKLGARGWIGMTWPKKYGGQERSALERYVLTEEMLAAGASVGAHRSEEHTSELQSLMRISYAVFCLKKKKKKRYNNT